MSASVDSGRGKERGYPGAERVSGKPSTHSLLGGSLGAPSREGAPLPARWLARGPEPGGPLPARWLARGPEPGWPPSLLGGSLGAWLTIFCPFLLIFVLNLGQNHASVQFSGVPRAQVACRPTFGAILGNWGLFFFFLPRCGHLGGGNSEPWPMTP